MHRRRDIYGDDAEEFKPEHWETLRAGWGYLPFNGGPRICLGQQFALAEASYAIVRLCQEFAGLEDRDGGVWREQAGLTTASADGVRVGLVAKAPAGLDALDGSTASDGSDRRSDDLKQSKTKPYRRPITVSRVKPVYRVRNRSYR